MQFFYWNSSFEIGLPAIDEQHQKLIDLINDLGSAIATQGEIPKIKIILDRLRHYIDFHFRDEERLFEQSAMPEREQLAHKAKHYAFEKKIDSILAEKKLTDLKATEEIFDFLVTWLINHILGTDRSIPQYLEGQGSSLPVPDENDFTDINSSRVTQTLIHALNESEKRFRLLSDNAPVMIWITNQQGKRIFYNKVWSEFIGEDVNGDLDVWFEIIHPGDRAAYNENFGQLLKDPKPADFEYRARNRQGEYRVFMERIIPRKEESGVFVGLVSCTVDITSLKQAEESLLQANITLEIEVAKRTEKIRTLMLTDTLTNTKNRRYLMDQLETEVSRSQRYGADLSLIFFDIDHFKRVNDSFGHGVGDTVLTLTAGSIMKQLRDCDQLCRYGGEEFVALLPETSLGNAQIVAGRVLDAIRKAKIPELGKAITISAGVGQWQKGESKDEFLERCDQALYAAKKAGRDRFCLAD